MIKTALLCLALNSYREARGESLSAQIAAAKILKNRATLNQTHVCKELAKHRQFAWVRKYGITHPHPRGKLDQTAWQKAKRLAKNLDAVNVRGISKKHLYFNTLALGKRYKTKTKPIVIGQLIFY